MNPERLQLKSMLADANKQYRNLDTEASGLIVLIRYYLSPYEEILNLDLEKILILAQKLNDTKIKMQELKTRIKNLERELE